MPANLFPLGLAALGGLGRGLEQSQLDQSTLAYRQLQMQLEQQRQQQMIAAYQAMAGGALGGGGFGGGAGGWGPQMQPSLYGPGGGPGYGAPTPYAPYAPGQITRYDLPTPGGSLQGPSTFMIPGTDQPVTMPAPISTAMPSGADDPRLGGAGIAGAAGTPGGPAPTPEGSALAGEVPDQISTGPYQATLDLPALARGVGGAADQTTYPSDYAGGYAGAGGAVGPQGPMGAAGDLQRDINAGVYGPGGMYFPRHGPRGPVGYGGGGYQPTSWRTGYAVAQPMGPAGVYGSDISAGWPMGYGGGYGGAGPYSQFYQPVGYGGGYGGAQQFSPFTDSSGGFLEGGAAPGRATGFRGFPSRGELGGLGQVTNEIYGLESGWGRNAQTNWGASGGAHGPMQITPGTFNAYAQAGERIDSWDDNLRVGQRITADLWQKSGGDAAATMVGYNAGEGAMRKFQAAGDDLNAVKLEPAYRRAVAQVQQGQFRTQLNTDMGTMMSPQERGMSGFGAQRTLSAMPNPLAFAGRLSIGDLARTIERANPGMSPAVKAGAFFMLYPMLEEQNRQNFQQSWEMYKEQEHEREFGVTHEEREEEFRVRMEEQMRPHFGTPEDFTYTMPDGTKKSITAIPITQGRGAGQLIDPTTQQPIQLPKEATDLRRAPLKYETTGDVAKEELMQVLDKDGRPIRTVNVYRDKQGNRREVDTGAPFKVDAAAGEHSVPVTPAIAERERQEATQLQIGGPIDEYAQAIADYRKAPLSGWAIKSKWGEAVMNRVMEISKQRGQPYDEAQWIARTSGVRALAGGQLGNTLQSMSTVADHILTLSDLADALASGTTDSRTWNRLSMAVRTEFGWTAQLDFNAAKQIVADEIAKAVIGGRNAEADRQGLQDSLRDANTGPQLQSVMQKFETLIGGQLGSLRRRIVGGGIQTEQWFRGQLSDDAIEMFGEHIWGPGGAPTEGRGGGRAGRAGPQLQPIPVPDANKSDPDGPYDNGWTKRGDRMYPPGQDPGSQ